MVAVVAGFSVVAAAAAAAAAPATAGPAVESSETGSCVAEYVRRLRGADLERFKNWLATASLPVSRSGDDRDLSTAHVYLADIDNDGAQEIVVARHLGNSRLVDLQVYRPSGDAYKPEPTPPSLLVGATDFTDPLSGAEQLLVRFCGRTYINLQRAAPNGAGYAPARETWLWQKGTDVHPVCTAAWLAEQHRLFQSLYDHGRYDEAYWALDGQRAFCGPATTPNLRAWMDSDLALTALRLGAPGACLDWLADARRTLTHTQGMGVLKKALAANAAACGQARAELQAKAGGAEADLAAYDFSWLLDLRSQPEHRVAHEARFDALLAATVPDTPAASEACSSGTLRDILKRFLWPPAEIAIEGHALTLSASAPHAAFDGMLWIDADTRQSLIEVCGLLASTTVGAGEIPAAAWDQTNNFNLGRGAVIQFFGPDRKWQEIQTPGPAVVSGN